jgi:glucosamine--fructose-6-phosphate aminotransferase (isomerizing)
MVGVRLGSPLIFGYHNDGDFFFSSDSQALTGYAEKMIYLEDGDMLHVKDNDFLITTGGKPVVRTTEEMDQQALEAAKGTYKHFMLKEIYEQPNIIRRIYKGRVDFDERKLTADAFHGMQQEGYDHITFVACGTSYHAGWLASYRFEHLAGLTTQVEIASEYENKPLRIDEKQLHVFISQSGETADSIQCLKLIRELGGKTFGVVNVVGSTIARLTESGLFTRAGTEIGVASTKAFTAQAVCLLLVALFMAKKRGLRYMTYKRVVRELAQLPEKIETILDQTEYIRSIAAQLTDYKNFFFLGRRYQLPIAYESSLKFKEISYLHSEAYPAGELKHGPLALIDGEVPTVMFMPDDDMFEKNLSSMHEIKARGGKVLVVSDRKVTDADRQITFPSSVPQVSPILTAVVGQLLAYHVADLLNHDIDKPRNLAKSVTVK